MADTLFRMVDTALVWAVAAALLFWPQMPGRWRRALALVASAAGMVFLIFAATTEGLRETPTVSVFLMGKGYVTQRAEALASLHYYAAAGVCFLLGTGGLALSEAHAERIGRHWLAFAIGAAVFVTAFRFVLEKLAAPYGWTQAVGITWISPVVGAFFAWNVAREGRGLGAFVASLFAYGVVSRAAVAGLMAVATTFRLGSHYDVSSLVRVANPFTRGVYEFEPGSAQQILNLGVLPQLGVWPLYTVASGLIGAAVAFALARVVKTANGAGARAKPSSIEGFGPAC
jgi:hypothetical protein